LAEKDAKKKKKKKVKLKQRHLPLEITTNNLTEKNPKKNRRVGVSFLHE